MCAFLPGPPVFLHRITNSPVVLWRKAGDQSVVACASTPHPSPTPSSTPATPQQAALIAALQDEIPAIFDPADPGPNLSLYDPDVAFRDPLNRFRGAARYAANIAFLTSSPVFTKPALSLHDIWPVKDNIVRTRWTLAMTAGLPWKPRVAFTGTSDYVLNPETGLVSEHVDVWDSLDGRGNAAFPSPQAVRDLVVQCAWSPQPLPDQNDNRIGGSFDLLRRAKDYSIRRYPASAQFWKMEVDAADSPEGKLNSECPTLSRISGEKGLVQPLKAVTVAVLRLGRDVGLGDVHNRRAMLLSFVKADNAAVFNDEPCVWLVRYPSIMQYSDELWVLVDKLETRS